MIWTAVAKGVSRAAGTLLIGAIWGYRILLAPLFPQVCRFQPTCSAYGIEAIRCHGALAGGWLTLRRLLRCRPWGGRGYDPVPEGTGAAARAAPRDPCLHPR